MATRILGTGTSQISIQKKRDRQTPKGESAFAGVLAGGAQVLLAGAEIATGVVGGGVLTAALARTRERIATRSGGASGPLGGGSDTSVSRNALGSTTGTGNHGSTAGASNDYDAMKRLQDESREMNMFFLQLQQKMQEENRRFSTLSNILKSKHDTARSAINNIRS